MSNIAPGRPFYKEKNMAKPTVKRPRSAKRRTLPPDAPSLIAMIASLHEKLRKRAEHLKKESRDRNAQQAVRELHDQRAQAWLALFSMEPNSALSLAARLNVRLPKIAHPPTQEEAS